MPTRSRVSLDCSTGSTTADAAIEAVREAVGRFAVRLVGADRAADLASASLLVVLERLRSDDPPRDPTRFALGVVFKKAKATRRRSPLQLDDANVRAAAPSAAIPDPARLAEVREWLDYGMARIPADDRALLHLFYSEGLAYERIATIVGASSGSVGRKLHDARRRLARALESQGGAAMTALLPALRIDATSVSEALRAFAETEAALSAASIGTGGGGGVFGKLVGFVIGGTAVMKIISGIVGVVAIAFATWWMFQDASPNGGEGKRVGRGAEGSASIERTDVDPAVSSTAPEAGRGAPEPVVAAPFAESQATAAPKLRGVVVDEARNPVVGARVYAEAAASVLRDGGLPIDAKGLATRSEADGTFELSPKEDGRAFDLRVVADAFAPTIVSNVRLRGEDVVVVLSRGTAVVGTVFDPDKRPLKGAAVSVECSVRGRTFVRRVETDEKGDYRFDAMPPTGPEALARFVVDAPPFALQMRVADARGLRDREDFYLARGAVLEGVVRSADDGRPIPDAEVVWWTSQAPGLSNAMGRVLAHPLGSRVVGRTRTDGAGKYRFERIPVEANGAEFTVSMFMGEKRLGGVAAYAPGFAAAGAAAPLSKDDGAVVSIDLALRRPVVVVGRVVDGFGASVEGARVFVDSGPVANSKPDGLVPGEEGPLGGSVRTDANGNFVHERVPAPLGELGKATVIVCGCDLGVQAAKSAEVEIHATGSNDLGTLVLGPSRMRRVRGVVRNVDGEPIDGVMVTTRISPPSSTDANGRFEIALPTPEPRPPEARSAKPRKHPGGTVEFTAKGYVHGSFGAPEDDASFDVVLMKAGAPPADAVAQRAAEADRRRVIIVALGPDGVEIADRIACTIARSAAPDGPLQSDSFANAVPIGLGKAEARLAEGAWTATISAPRHVKKIVPFVVEPGAEPLRVVATLDRGTVLKGRVTWSSQKRAGATTIVASLLGGTSRDFVSGTVASNGDYYLDGLAPGAWRVQVHSLKLGPAGTESTALATIESLEVVAGVATIERDIVVPE